MEDFVLPQLTEALKSITETRSRSACPKLWSLTDRLSEAQTAAPPRQGRFRTAVAGFDLLLGLFVLLVGVVSGAAPLVFVGLAAWLWGLLRLSRHAPKVLAILNLVGSGSLVLLGALSPALGRVLVPGLITMAAGFVSTLSHIRKDPAPYDSAAARLLEERARLPMGAVTFNDIGMRARSGPTIAYREWEGCWETADLLLPVWQDSILILRKGELTGGDLDACRSLLEEHLTVTRL